MGWERGLYYTRSRKVKGRVVRDYVGMGLLGQLASQLDQAARDERKLAKQRRKLTQLDLEALTKQLAKLNDRCDWLARAALVAAGFHQHKRGEWRKKRVKAKTSGKAPAPKSRTERRSRSG